MERALRQRDRRVMDYARAEGRAEALSNEIGQNKELMKQMMQAQKKNILTSTLYGQFV